MGRKKREMRVISVKITVGCHELVKEAARLKGESIMDYVDRVATERAKVDIEMEEKRLRSLREREWPRPDG